MLTVGVKSWRMKVEEIPSTSSRWPLISTEVLLCKWKRRYKALVHMELSRSHRGE